MNSKHARRLCLLAACAWMSGPVFATDQAGAGIKDYALSVYGGRLTDGDWHESFGPGSDFIDSDLAVIALSRTLFRSHDLSRSYELEGQIAKHSGLQDHLEYNLLGAVRWHRLPWSGKVKSTAAAALGVSYASEIPRAESTILKSDSERLLAYWYLELTLGPAHSDWQALWRLHHRSTAYGLFGDDGGANAVTLGIRYEFN